MTAGPLISGASKQFFPTDAPEVLRLRFRDVVHGAGRTRVVAGTGRSREQFCYWFYRLLERQGIRTHLARDDAGRLLQQDVGDQGLLVCRLQMVAVELIARFVARGHWVDTHKYPLLRPGAPLGEPVFEMCVKWRRAVQVLEFGRLSPWCRRLHRALARTRLQPLLMSPTVLRDDPRINADLAVALHHHAVDEGIAGRMLVSRDEAEQLRQLTLQVNAVLREFLAAQGWTLEDAKLEVGLRPGEAREFIVADEISQDSSRIRDRQGRSLTKDLHRNSRPEEEIRDGYARLAEAIRRYAA